MIDGGLYDGVNQPGVPDGGVQRSQAQLRRILPGVQLTEAGLLWGDDLEAFRIFRRPRCGWSRPTSSTAVGSVFACAKGTAWPTAVAGPTTAESSSPALARTAVTSRPTPA